MTNSPLRSAVVLILGALLQLNCGGCSTDESGGGGGDAGDGKGDPVDPGGPPKVIAAPPSIDDTLAPAPRPVLSLSLRGSTEPKLAVGWPWLLQATVIHPAALGGTHTAPFSVSGESAFALVLRNAEGRSVPVTFERLGTPLDTAIPLETNSQLQLAWRLSPDETSKLSAGRYSLTLELQLEGVTAKSAPVDITLSPPADAGVYTQRLVNIDDAIARGDLTAAEAEIDSVLGQNPEHVQARARKGEVRELQGQLGAAYEEFNSAINSALKAEPGAPEGGPRHLYFRRSALAEQLDGGVY